MSERKGTGAPTPGPKRLSECGNSLDKRPSSERRLSISKTSSLPQPARTPTPRKIVPTGPVTRRAAAANIKKTTPVTPLKKVPYGVNGPNLSAASPKVDTEKLLAAKAEQIAVLTKQNERLVAARDEQVAVLTEQNQMLSQQLSEALSETQTLQTEVQNQKQALESLQAAKNALAEEDDLVGSMEIIHHAVQNGLTKKAAAVLEKEFASQERILQELQRDNELKTQDAVQYKRQITKLEAFCAKYFGPDDWKVTVFGSMSETSKCAIEESSQRGQTTSTEADTQLDLHRTHTDSSDTPYQTEDVKSPSKAAHSSISKSGNSFPLPNDPTAGESSFVSALDAWDVSLLAMSPKKQRSLDSTVTVDRAALTSLVEAQNHFIQKLHIK